MTFFFKPQAALIGAESSIPSSSSSSPGPPPAAVNGASDIQSLAHNNNNNVNGTKLFLRDQNLNASFSDSCEEKEKPEKESGPDKNDAVLMKTMLDNNYNSNNTNVDNDKRDAILKKTKTLLDNITTNRAAKTKYSINDVPQTQRANDNFAKNTTTTTTTTGDGPTKAKPRKGLAKRVALLQEQQKRVKEESNLKEKWNLKGESNPSFVGDAGEAAGSATRSKQQLRRQQQQQTQQLPTRSQKYHSEKPQEALPVIAEQDEDVKSPANEPVATKTDEIGRDQPTRSEIESDLNPREVKSEGGEDDRKEQRIQSDLTTIDEEQRHGNSQPQQHSQSQHQHTSKQQETLSTAEDVPSYSQQILLVTLQRKNSKKSSKKKPITTDVKKSSQQQHLSDADVDNHPGTEPEIARF